MSSQDYYRGHVSTPKAPGDDDSWANKSPGPYIATVKNNRDPLFMGRLQVNIPALSKTTDPVASNLITCEYLSPFYGNKDVAHNIPGSTKYSSSQHSYGFWAVPPDIGTKVLVIFAEGKMDQGFWIGCVQDPVTNHMVPGIAASEKTWDKSSGGPAGQFSSDVDKEKTYGTLNVPAGELNRTSADSDPGGNYNKFNKPIHPLANVLAQQGLSADDVRGTTSSSARRETPSQVFGFSTPGPKDTSTTEQPVGVKDKPRNDFVSRGIGHTFVMDDGDAEGENQLTRLRTASGHQLLMHDTEGVVYLANGSGNSWIEMSPEGKIYIYAQDGLNIRSSGDFDLHSDGNINFHSAHDIKFTAEGSVVNNADAYLMNMGRQGIFNSSQAGVISDYALQGLTAYTNGNVLIGSGSAPEPPQNPNQRAGANASRGGGAIHLAGPQVHFNSVKAQKSWGPSWLTPEAMGIVEDTSQNDVNITVGKDERLEANTASTKTTIANLVTHEPFTRAPSGVQEDVSQWQNEDEWKRLSQTPGTLEYMAQQNRLSPDKNIRNLQFLTDQKKYIAENNFPPGIKSPIVGQSSGSKLNNIATKLKNKVGLSNSDIRVLEENKLFNRREARIAGISVQESIVKNTQVIASKVNRALKAAAPDVADLKKLTTKYAKYSPNKISLDKAKTLADEFTSKYNKIYNVKSVVPNLSKTDVQNFIINKVSGGRLTSASISNLSSNIGSVVKNTRNFFTRSAGNSIPPSMRGTFKGKVSQVAASVNRGFRSAFKSFFSDARLKEQIVKIGTSPMGINIYSFKYKNIEGTYQGVMAQEVPWATEMTNTGFYAVDYNKVDVEFRRLH